MKKLMIFILLTSCSIGTSNNNTSNEQQEKPMIPLYPSKPIINMEIVNSIIERVRNDNSAGYKTLTENGNDWYNGVLKVTSYQYNYTGAYYIFSYRNEKVFVNHEPNGDLKIGHWKSTSIPKIYENQNIETVNTAKYLILYNDYYAGKNTINMVILRNDDELKKYTEYPYNYPWK